MSNTYKCSICEGVFEKGWTEEEAEEELKNNFGEEYTPSDCGLVCDDCYKKYFS